MPLLDLQKLTIGLSRTWSGYLRDWDRSLRSGNYPETTRYNYGSMRKAAALLHTTQSAVSRSIADLEHTIGAKLLDRSAHGIEPTRYGHALLRRGAAVFDELRQGVREIEFLSNPEAGELLIGSGSAFAEGFVLAVIDRLSRTYPRVAWHLMPFALTSLYGQLRERRIELAFSGNSDSSRKTTSMPKCCSRNRWWWRQARKIRGCAVAGLRSPISSRSRGTWSPPGTVVDRLVVAAFRANGLEPPRAAVYTDAINVRIRLAATRGFLIVVPASMLSLPARHELLRRVPV